MPLRRVHLAALALACLWGGGAHGEPARNERVEALIAQMTLEEKVGQLNMVSFVPTHETSFEPIAKGLKDGTIGGLFNVHGLETARRMQERAGESRLKIPLFLALDVVHGYRAIFPTPLAQAASFDMEAIRRAERIAASEATADGVNMLLTPMLDVTRDARWGRVVEGVGESAFLASRIAEARVAGVQGDGLRAKDAAVACVKHFGANGAVEGGRDYTAADLSERAIRETYLPPFQAAVDAGARCMMAAFNAPDGVPSIANPRLLTDILRGEWGFGGVVMSDFEAIDELLAHGYAADQRDAARLAFAAGAEIDMQSSAYAQELPNLVRNGVVKEAALDAAVRRVLTLKAELGLFDDPMRGAGPDAPAGPPAAENMAAAQALAEQSFVLLKNEKRVLPFSPDIRKLALIGPLGNSPADTLGPWAGRGEPEETVTLKMGLERRLGPDVEVAFTPGGTTDGSRDEEIAAAVESARDADMVVLALGERFDQSGEGSSRADLELAGDQMKLATAVLALGKPTVAVIFAGRPLVLTELAAKAPAILYAWQPGSMGGTALARTLTGDVNPSGRLPMTFPRAVGQVPIHHDMRPTGRPFDPEDPYTTGYRDEAYTPLYPFGFGLGYADFSYNAPKLDRAALRDGETAVASVVVANTGKRAGTTVVQLYVRPKLARIARPAKELRGFVRVTLQPGEARTVEMAVTPETFAYWRSAQAYGATAGPVEIMTGPNAEELKSTTVDYRP
ncbi:glycoside hydrolase family 3 N-terminal domain-containing protein [Hansschlegelia sp. KR7-227]|uniref:glycoside hydrolase family 3 N-terminal domain-containing protein n=1 Tax=Hansschlegelia sp. KR7-227 TaxID=3400914 RepID=UPI003C05DF74